MRFNRHWQDGGDDSFITDVTFTNAVNVRFNQITGTPYPADFVSRYVSLHRKPTYAYVTMSSTDASAGEIGMRSIAVIANIITDAGAVHKEYLYTCQSYTYTMSLTPDDIVWTKYFDDEKDYLPSARQKIYYGYPAWNGHTFIFDLSGIPDAADGHTYDIAAAGGFVASTPQKMTVTTRLQIK